MRIILKEMNIMRTKFEHKTKFDIMYSHFEHKVHGVYRLNFMYIETLQIIRVRYWLHHKILQIICLHY